jgi:hypothetical protein
MTDVSENVSRRVNESDTSFEADGVEDALRVFDICCALGDALRLDTGELLTVCFVMIAV